MGNELVSRLRKIGGAFMNQAAAEIEKRDAVILDLTERLGKAEKNYYRCRNELCLKCGNYRERHKGACDGCYFNE